MILVLDGEIRVEWKGNTEIFRKGNVCLIPANLNEYSIEKTIESSVYQVSIP